MTKAINIKNTICPNLAIKLVLVLTTQSFPLETNAQQTARQLPPCRLDSFVHQAGGAAEAIYGDEGIRTPPPYFGFDQSHRINAGIFGNRDAGLTTGHGSVMPSAWGDDEFLAPPNGEQCQSGPNNGDMRLQHDADSYDCSAQIQSADQKMVVLQAKIDLINRNLVQSVTQFRALSTADIKGRQDLSLFLQNNLNYRQQLISQLQTMQEAARKDFGKQF
ncbi:MAG: hypothetical protein C0473_00195 [Cyanobacteria bacterium DS3.002]|nr:hypothetical protein [Cyanobacteria bacterium DS3.002]MBA4049404.1 hypothetical protein [Cyanobacteria bacterium DS2.008]MBA4075979.1 hypothetical protein [Cyanobacteria bacterium PR.023]